MWLTELRLDHMAGEALHTMPPLVLRGVVVHLAQSESLYPVIMHGDVCHLNWLMSPGLPAKYFPMLHNALMCDIRGVDVCLAGSFLAYCTSIRSGPM